MKPEEITLDTPRGIIKIHTLFDSEEEARKAGWGLWFTHLEYDIYAKENRVGAAVMRIRYKR